MTTNVPCSVLPRNDAETMRELAKNRNLALPIDICGDAPRKFKAEPGGDDWSIALTIWYGNSPWNFIEYWNSAQFRGVPSSGLKALWIPSGFLDDAPRYEALIEMARSRVYSSQHRSRLRLISYDEDETRLREITSRIVKDFKWNLYVSDPIVRKKGGLPEFKRAPAAMAIFQDRSDRPRHEQVSGGSAFVEITPPTDVLPNHSERWIAELAVEDPQQERFFANRAAWWKLPRKNQVASLFVPHSRCRVGSDYSICAEVSTEQQGVLLNIPKPSALFSALLVPSAPPDWGFAPHAANKARNSLYVRSSDKGRYALGVLGLFESLQKAGYVFEHRFWAGVIESLSTASASPHTKDKVRSDLQRIQIDALAQSEGIDRLVEEVLDIAGRIQRPRSYITFSRLFDLYWKHLETLGQEERLIEIGAEHDVAGEKQIRDAARRYLRHFLSELTSRKLFLQGAEVRCQYCLATLWYHFDDLRSVIACRGCRKEVHLPAEIDWSYALNELVTSAVRDHGVAPVIRTALRLFTDSRECFYFMPGIEIRDYSSDPEKQLCELDLVWIRDGAFGVAEVKRTPKKFEVSGDLAMILCEILPDRLLLASPTGAAAEMERFKGEIRSKIDRRITVDCWGNEAFDRSADLGWDTFRHSVSG